ncbi:MAG: DUF1835 domain-containing protein [Fulvivirga sp.]
MVYHILNGDALKEQFPKNIEGEVIVARECLVDGDIHGGSLEELFTTRARYLSKHYKEVSEAYYYKHTVPEIKKITEIPAGSEVNLWFEDDLFCQVNFWFVLHTLMSHANNLTIYLIRPEKHTSYGFASYSPDELNDLLANKVALDDLHLLTTLWPLYQKQDAEALKSIAKGLSHKYPFILTAVEAFAESIPNGDSLGRPSDTVRKIIAELNTTEFGPVFREFCKREAIYGYGDLQVKRLFNEVINK